LKEKTISVSDPKFDGWLNRNIKDNLREENDYVIVNEEIWTFLHQLFGGYEIR